MNKKVSDFLSAISAWGRQKYNIKAILLVGSYARGNENADSDIDIVLIVEDQQEFLESDQWVHRFGDANRVAIEDYGKVTSLRVFYESGMEIEFGIGGLDWVSNPIDSGTRTVIQKGIQIIYEKENYLSSNKEFMRLFDKR